MWICIAPCREHTSKMLGYGTRYQHTPRSPANGMNHTCLTLKKCKGQDYSRSAIPEQWAP